jgi:hypothetical protein
VRKSKRRKYKGDLHTRPYDLEESTFDKDKEDADFDTSDLATLPDHYARVAVSESAEFGTDGNDTEDRLSEVGGKARPSPVLRQLVQEAGGYSFEKKDPKSEWKTATRFYCRTCGEWIASPPTEIDCEVPLDPCPPEMLKGGGGCQSCRVQKAFDLKDARGVGNPPQTCRPKPGEKESRCAKDWRNGMERWERAVAKAQKRGTKVPAKPSPAEPKWTERDIRKMRDAEEMAQIRADRRRQFRPPVLKRQPQGIWDLDLRGTGFTHRDHLRKPGWR